MVEVATGADTGEQLPMVLRVPRLTYNPLHACWIPYSILGFGDILVPGLLVSYCHAFDLLRDTPCKIYWVVSNVCEFNCLVLVVKTVDEESFFMPTSFHASMRFIHIREKDTLLSEPLNDKNAIR